MFDKNIIEAEIEKIFEKYTKDCSATYGSYEPGIKENYYDDVATAIVEYIKAKFNVDIN